MLRSTGFTVVAWITVLLPAFAHSAMETLQIQIGKDKAVLDTVTIDLDFGKPPEIDHPNGVKWADLEKDSAWEDANGRHVRRNHSFQATMGSRKGYGNEYIHFTKYADQEPHYSANVSFVFPGDTSVQIGWEPVHMYLDASLDPYRETGFVSGSEVYGQVSTFALDGTEKETENLTQGQWALLLTRKKARPEGETKPIVSRKETLRVQIGKDDAILDTFVVMIDYGMPPEIKHPDGLEWADLEKDSAWTDDQGWYVRYSHAFMAAIKTQKGFGSDYLSLSVSSEDFFEEPQFNANTSITIPGDTTLTISWDPNHMVEKAEAFPFHESAFKSGSGQYASVSRYTQGNDSNLASGQWAKLLIREDGWEDVPVALHPVKPARRSGDWIINLGPGTVLRAPPGVTGLKVLDVHGRIHWESRNLREGAQVTLPGDLPKGALRCFWQSGRG